MQPPHQKKKRCILRKTLVKSQQLIPDFFSHESPIDSCYLPTNSRKNHHESPIFSGIPEIPRSLFSGDIETSVPSVLHVIEALDHGILFHAKPETPQNCKEHHLHPIKLHPWKLTCPPKRDHFNRKYIFQPLIFSKKPVFRGVLFLLKMDSCKNDAFLRKKASFQVPYEFQGEQNLDIPKMMVIWKRCFPFPRVFSKFPC